MVLLDLLLKINTHLILKTCISISLITQLSLIYLNGTIEGKIKYLGYIILPLTFLLSVFLNKDLFQLSPKSQRKIILSKNLYILLLTFFIIYYPILFYTNYNHFRNSYTSYLFILCIIITGIFHSLLIITLSDFLKTNKIFKKFKVSEDQIDDDIRRAMIQEEK